MKHRSDVAQGRDIVARWCALAERRLEYLTELFETGRWRRFHSEVAFLENIREAKTAVETWRDLLVREATPDNSPVDMSWLGHIATAKRPSGQTMHDRSRLPLRAPITESTPRQSVVRSVPANHVASDEVPAVPEMETPALGAVAGLLPDVDAIERRYPLLRNAL